MMNEPVNAIRTYHQETKHSTQAYAPSPGFLDWDAQPDPFRRFTGAPVIELPLIKGGGRCGYDSLYHPEAQAPDDLNIESLGLFFELALGLSAWKAAGPDRWPLRSNPSSGNLHPTEGYLLLWCNASDDLAPGLYHYAPHDHLLERRAVLSEQIAAELSQQHPNTFGAVAFSTITWREEWKYGARAFRYCQLDVGHALASTRFAAGVLGWRMTYDDRMGDDTLAALLGLDRGVDYANAEAELPDAIAVLGTRAPDQPIPWDRLIRALDDWRGTPSQTSAERVAWPQVAKAITAVHKPTTSPKPSAAMEIRSIAFNAEPCDGEACSLIRSRRSAQRMDGKTAMRRVDFERALYRTYPGNGTPFDMLPFDPALNLLLFIHAVDELDPGLYAFIRAPGLFDDFRNACRQENLAWEPVGGTPLPLYRLDAPADYRKRASQISCYQGIAGRGAFSVGMIGAIGKTLNEEGAWAYRRLHWEAGIIGQVLYLEAESGDLRGTGIGCFFDDEVHRLLGLETDSHAPWQTLYHFTVGGPLDDNRLTTEPAYAHLRGRHWT